MSKPFKYYKNILLLSLLASMSVFPAWVEGFK